MQYTYMCVCECEAEREPDDEGNEEQRMYLEFKGPSRPGGPPTLAIHDYDVSEDGLLQAIVDGKELLRRYHQDGVCHEAVDHVAWEANRGLLERGFGGRVEQLVQTQA